MSVKLFVYKFRPGREGDLGVPRVSDLFTYLRTRTSWVPRRSDIVSTKCSSVVEGGR